MMRVLPIEKPRSLRMRLAYAYGKKTYGRVITPMKVVMARVPAILPVYQKIAGYMKQSRLDPSLLLLIQGYTAGYNQCGFCIDITRSFAAHDAALLEKLWRVGDYGVDPIFTDAERAALAYVEAVTRNRAVTDDVFETMKAHYSDEEIVEITLVNAIEHFYNLVNGPLGIESDGLCAVKPRGIEASAVSKLTG